MLKKESGLAPIAIILIIAGVLILAGGAYLWQTQENRPSIPESPALLKGTSSWQTYRNDQYGFEFAYPKSATLSFPPASNEILSQMNIEFKEKSSSYNSAIITVFVYKKGIFNLDKIYPLNNECGIYNRSKSVVNGKVADLLEVGNCKYVETESYSFIAVISLADGDLIYDANLNNSFIKENNLYNQILSTFKFTK